MALAGTLVFYWAYREWLAGFLLTLLLLLPWFSLLITLPAALLGKLGIQHAQTVTLGSDGRIQWQLTGLLPTPTLVGKIRCRLGNSRQAGQRQNQRQQGCQHSVCFGKDSIQILTS